MPFLNGTFVKADGEVEERQRTVIEVVHDEPCLHIWIDGSGRGTITMENDTGTGVFTTRDGQQFKLSITRTKTGLAYEVSREQDPAVIATGEITDLSPWGA